MANYYKNYQPIYDEIIEKEPSLYDLVEIIKNTEVDDLSLIIDNYNEGNNREILIFHYMKTILRLSLKLSNEYLFDLGECISEGYMFLLSNIDKYIYQYQGTENKYIIGSKIQSEYKRIMINKINSINEISIYEEDKDILVNWEYCIDKGMDLQLLKYNLQNIMYNMLGTEREKEICKLYYGLFDYECLETLGNVGELYNIGRERVRQILCKFHAKLKHPSRIIYLKPYYNDYMSPY